MMLACLLDRSQSVCVSQCKGKEGEGRDCVCVSSMSRHWAELLQCTTSDTNSACVCIRTWRVQTSTNDCLSSDSSLDCVSARRALWAQPRSRKDEVQNSRLLDCSLRLYHLQLAGRRRLAFSGNHLSIDLLVATAVLVQWNHLFLLVALSIVAHHPHAFLLARSITAPSLGEDPSQRKPASQAGVASQVANVCSFFRQRGAAKCPLLAPNGDGSHTRTD